MNLGLVSLSASYCLCIPQRIGVVFPSLSPSLMPALESLGLQQSPEPPGSHLQMQRPDQAQGRQAGDMHQAQPVPQASWPVSHITCLWRQLGFLLTSAPAGARGKRRHRRHTAVDRAESPDYLHFITPPRVATSFCSLLMGIETQA